MFVRVVRAALAGDVEASQGLACTRYAGNEADRLAARLPHAGHDIGNGSGRARQVFGTGF